MRKNQKRYLLILISLFLLPHVLIVWTSEIAAAFSDVVPVEEDFSMVQEATGALSVGISEVDFVGGGSSQRNSRDTVQGGHRMLQFASGSNALSFTRHLMCKNHDDWYDPIDPTTIFRPSDTKAECLTTVSVNDSIEFRWYYRDNSSKTWVSCYNWSAPYIISGEYHYAGYLLIAGYWPGSHYPRAYKVDVYLDESFAFSEFFEVTNGGINSPRMCEDVDGNGDPVNLTSRFRIDNDTKAHHYLRVDKIAYFNEVLDFCHNFTTLWIQPNGSTYQMFSTSFSDYKDTNSTWNYWKYGHIRNDYISINSSTPVGNWRVEVYLDTYYFNNTWMRYGPIATTQFVVGSEPVADWTFMVYLDGDNSLENATINIFEKMASVGSSSKVNIISQMDRVSGQNGSYGNWTDCKRFNVTKDMSPTAGNATLDLGEVNMGHPDTLKDFVNWTINNYQANYYFLALFDHGTGIAGVCFDETSGNDALSLPELNQALDGLPVMDVVFLDACSMSLAEVAYQIRDHANVLVGPEGLGYAPSPYDDYLSSLTSSASMLPKAFAEEVVTHYIEWCTDIEEIKNATMSATDLTKIARLTAAIDDFAIQLKEQEDLNHGQISQARNLTQLCQGPFAGDTDYYIDLYHFAQRIHQYVSDEELRYTADQVMTAIDSIVIIEGDKARPNSHGLSIYFPNTKEKYEDYGSVYDKTTFAEDTPWDEFVKYHLSWHVLIIQTSYPGILVKVDEEWYTTDAFGEIEVFVLPGNHTVNSTTPILTSFGQREVFTQWSDSNTSNPRTLQIDKTVTLKAEYETQHRLIMDADFGATTPSVGEHWYKKDETVEISATPPSLTFNENEERYSWLGWKGTGNGSYDGESNQYSITLNGPINETAAWKHEYRLTVMSDFGSPTVTPSGNWFESGEEITAYVNSPVSAGTTRNLCTGWNGTGSVPTAGATNTVTFTINEPSTIRWNWKIQHLLTIRTDPVGLGPQPIVSQPGLWYDENELVTCTAQKINGYVFDYWTIGELSWDRSVNPITVTMNKAHEIVAHYTRARTWWETIFRPDIAQVILGILGVVLSVSLIGTTWVRTRKRRGIVKTLLSEIDETYSRQKTNPHKCEEELSRLRNTILEGLTDGRINEEGYAVLDSRIDKYLEELRKQKWRERSG